MAAIFTAIIGLLQGLVGPIFTFLNTKVDAQTRVTLAKTRDVASIGSAELSNLAAADQLRNKPIWGPTLYIMIAILAPFIWHEWQVVLDSCRFLISVNWVWYIPLPELVQHRPGSWGIPSIGRPGADGQSAWDKTEQAIFTSFFVGASTAMAAVAAIRAIKK